MTYVELIVVMSIMSIMSAIVFFNYQSFQSRIEIKSLSNDIALKVVQAQKEAMSGQLAPVAQQVYQANNGLLDSWRPSYGVFFDKQSSKAFSFFADLDNSAVHFDGTQACSSNIECLDSININKSYYVSDLNIVCDSGAQASVNNFSVTFTRPDSKADIESVPSAGCSIYSASVNLSSPNGATSSIVIYNSGRIQFK